MGEKSLEEQLTDAQFAGWLMGYRDGKKDAKTEARLRSEAEGHKGEGA